MNMIMDFSQPKTAFEWAEMLAKTRTIPKEYWDRPHEVLATIQYGSELGLKPMQALQGISNVNGKPSLYGDLLLAVCMNSVDFVDMVETLDENTLTASCTVIRRNRKDLTRTYDKKDAETAGLWNRKDNWKAYPKRMLQMRARSFALRDAFADMLRGVIATEEAHDYPPPKDISVEHVNPQAERLAQKTKYEEYLDRLEEAEYEEWEEQKIKDHLRTLIIQKRIEPSVVARWLDRAGVSDLMLMPVETAKKIINHLEKKE